MGNLDAQEWKVLVICICHKRALKRVKSGLQYEEEMQSMFLSS